MAVIVVENKSDLESVISKEQIQGVLEARSFKLIQTSATENKNVDAAFEELVKEIPRAK